MMSKIVRTKSECKGCPLDGAVTQKVYGQSDAKVPDLVLLGEAPGRQEDESGMPFVGSAGRTFKDAIEVTGHLWHRTHRTNAALCRFPSNDEKSYEATEALRRCKPGLFEELHTLHKKGVKVIVAAGASAMNALGIDGSIHKMRGSVFTLKFKEADFFLHGFKGIVLEPTDDGGYDMLCVPTFHPAFLGYSGDPRHRVTFINDLEKAYELTESEYKPPEEHFNIFPSIQELEGITDELLARKRKPLLGVDIETSGFVPGHASIITVGIATDGEHAFSIPFLKQGGKPYWKDAKERGRAHTCLKRLMAECPTMFQNALFDIRHLEHFGAPVHNVVHDTMILHHCINPELPHNLGYIVSVYGKTPYWKESMLTSAKAMIHADDSELRTYNMRDSVTLHQILPELIADARDSGTYTVYEKIAMPLVPPVMRMIENGILLDKKALKKWKAYLKGEEERLLSELKRLANLPKGFNVDSGDHLRYLLFAITPGQYDRAKRELATYEEPDSRKKKNTKKYAALIETVKTFDETEPFPRMRHTPKKTKSGSVSVDEEAMLNLQTAVVNRIDRIEVIRKKRPEHKRELETLIRIRDFITTYREYSKIEKLIATYTSFPTDTEDRVHSPYRITGTNTGRLSSGNKKGGEAGNMQNIPSSAKHLFIAPKGFLFLQFDYSNLELRVLAEISEDEVLRKVFKVGLNVHTENCKQMFGIDEDHPKWKAARRACKTYIFGRNYGGGLKGIHARVMKAVPELNLTYNHFVEIDEAYRAAHPAYDKWYNQTVKTVQSRQWLSNAFGRVRYFLGRPEEIVREGLNFPIQSTASDIINTAMIGIHALIIDGSLKAKLVGQVHDSLLFEVPKGSYKKQATIIKGVMQQPVSINGRRVSFPVDAEVGRNWAEMTELKV